MTERIRYHNPKFISQDVPFGKNKMVKDDGVRNIAVTFLTLETERVSSPTEDIHAGDDIRHKSKFLHEFRVRRKSPFIKKISPQLHKDDTFLELGLLGKGYLSDNYHNKPQTKTKDSSLQAISPTSTSPSILGLPPVTNRSSKSDTPTLSNIHQFSYLNTDFGFGKYRTDTFSGLGLHGSRHLFESNDLESRLATQARKHIEACTTVGMVRKQSRAAQNVLGLKRTIEEGVIIDKYGKLVPLPIHVGNHHKNSSHKLQSAIHSNKSTKQNKHSLPFISGNSSFPLTE